MTAVTHVQAAADWPADGLETVSACPVCGSGDRDLLYAGLEDRIFHCAPGRWDMHACRNCGSGYLDPRPTQDSIHIAYRDYYTHNEPERQPTGELGGVRRLKRALANGYKYSRFCTDLQPSSKLGTVAALLLPSQRATLDREYRHLPRRAGGGRVLDVGMGDGSFLQNARAMGWRVVGTDFDPEVVENARRRGLDARLGTVDAVEGPFDVITMSHVIEHLHDPVSVLRQCHRLLAPGGTLWLETPNVEAIGLAKFGVAWRGLEPPRHLVLFNRRSLKRALGQAGFNQIRDLRQPSVVAWIYAMSSRIRDGREAYDEDSRVPVALRLEIAAARLLEWLRPDRREFLAMTARKAD